VVIAFAATLCAGLAIISGFRRVDTKHAAEGGDMDLGELAQSAVLRGSQVDVARTRERTRRRRLWKLFVWLAPLSGFFYWRILTSKPLRVGMPPLSPVQLEIFIPCGVPHLSPVQLEISMPLGLIALLGVVLVVPMMSAGKSPHVRYDPSEIDV